MKINEYGFYLNGEKLIKIVKCTNLKAAKEKLNFLYPENFNIEIKRIRTFQLK